MFISLKKIIGLAVFTQSGNRLGKVSVVNLDTNSHTVQEYLARASIFNSRVFLIKPVQIVEITDKKMVVEDSVLKELLNSQYAPSLNYDKAINS